MKHTFSCIDILNEKFDILSERNVCFFGRVDKVIWPPQKDSSGDVSSVSPSSEQ